MGDYYSRYRTKKMREERRAAEGKRLKRREMINKRRETRDRRQKTREEKQEAGDKRREERDKRGRRKKGKPKGGGTEG